MEVYTGIDWSESKHDVAFLNQAGAVLGRLIIPHTPDGFQQFDTTRQKLGVATEECVVGLETSHNLLIDYLWARGYERVYVIPPNVTKSCRGRYRQSGAYTDQSAAYLIANLLRTDRHRFQPWHPDLPLTRHMRAKVSLLLHLTRSKVRLTNRLRAVLLRYYPAVVGVFSKLNQPVTLELIRTYPTPQAAAALSFEEFRAFARQHHYTQPKKLPGCYARLQTPQPEAAPEIVHIYQEEAVILATLLLNIVRAEKATQKELKKLFVQHPDYEIFDSLPGAGDLLAPGLLVKFGDDRQRFPSAGSVQALAGTCPVTERSGKRKFVKFRKACDREFRYIAQQWARHSLDDSVWACAYYQQVLARSGSKSHAHRCLANRWLAILWTLWQTGEPYDEAYHLRQRAERSKPNNVHFIQ
jgi:transposase